MLAQWLVLLLPAERSLSSAPGPAAVIGVCVRARARALLRLSDAALGPRPMDPTAAGCAHWWDD